MVMEYVAGIKTAWDLAKAVKVSTDAIDDAQIKLQVAELIGALADARIEAAESTELISSLQQQLRSKSQMEFNGHTYYKIIEGQNSEGPWCPTCYDVRAQEVRLQPFTQRHSSFKWACRECTSKYRDAT